jgi:hypothetical protein
MGVANRLALGLAFHDGEVSHALTRAGAPTGDLLAIEVNQTHVLWFHESFANECRRAKDQVITDTNGHVAAIAIGVVALPHALAQITNALLEGVYSRRVKEVEDFPGCFRVTTW